MTQNKVNQLVINKVESLEVYEALKKKGLSDEEIYLLTPEGIKTALNNVEIDVDSSLSATSTNPIQNKVVTEAINNIKIPNLSGGTAAANNAKIIGGVTVSGHNITAAQKTITAGDNVTITGGTDKITVAAADTHHTANLITGASSTAKANAAVTSNGSVYLNLIENDTVRNSHNIVGSGSVSVTSDANGKITIKGTDNNTDTKVNTTLATTSQAYLLGTTTTPTSSAKAVTSVADTGVYLGTKAGELVATHLNATESVSMGRKANTTIGTSSTALGINVEASGESSHAEGDFTTASGNDSHAEGTNTTASGNYSHAEGYGATASGETSHAEGYGTTASGRMSHAEGQNTVASGEYSHTEGSGTIASDSGAHAEGSETLASKAYSHAEGQGTIAGSYQQHVQGKYNIEDASYIYAHIVGNGGNEDMRSNAHTLDWSGNAWFSGDVYTGSTSGTNKDTGSKKLATEDFVTQEVGKISIPTLTKGTDTAATAQTLTPSTTTKKVSFTAMTDTTVSGHTVTDKNTTFTLDLSGFVIPSELSTPMVFKGTLGEDGTITALPTANNNTIGHTYKVITTAIYAGIHAEAGDMFTCSADPAWVLIPSGDEPKGTVTNVATGTDLTGGPITSTGTISHANITRSDPAVGNTLTPGYGGTFNIVESVTSSARGHVTAVQIRKVNMPAEQSLTKKTATVLTSATTISHSGGVATTNKIKATASGTAAGANGTANVITGYPNVINASFVNGVTNTTTTVVNGVSNTTAKALTGLGTASTVKAVTGYASPGSANFVNGVTNNTTSVVNSVTNTTAKALTGLGTASTVSAVTGYTPTNASFINGVTNNTTSVVNSVTSSTISVSNGILTIPKVTMLTGSSTTTVINKVSSTSGKALTGLGTPTTSSVVTGYPNVTNASFVNSVSSGTTTVINKVSSTNSKALTGLGTASTTDVVTGYPNVTNANFVNSVGKTTISVVNSVSSTTSNALTGLGTPTTATALTGVKITTQPTIKLEFDATNGQVSVVTGVSTPSVTLNKSTADVLTNETALG